MLGTTSAYIYRRPLEMPGRASRAAPPEDLTQISRWTNWGSLAVKAVAASHEKMFRAIKKEKDGLVNGLIQPLVNLGVSVVSV